MMSMSGMISIRARFFGIGEATCIIKTSFRSLIGRAGHGERDWYANLGNCARFESPTSKRAYGRVIQDRVPYTLGHSSVGDTSASWINGNDTDTAAGNVPTTRFVGIIRPWSADGAGFRL